MTGLGRGAPSGYLADDVPAPAGLRLQLNALQALCRQTIGVRLAALVIGTPFAMTGAADGAPRYAVLIAAVLGIMGSYAMLRDWDRFGPRLLAHPTLMAVDLALGAVLLLTASPASPLAYATVCTPLLAGLLYGWRGSGVFTGLQLTVLLTVYRAWEHRPGAATNTLLILGFCVGAGIIGVTLRNLLFRFGTATQALAEATSRLAVAEAVESERARLARELHDSVAKTLHGLALAADTLSASADRSADPRVLRQQADLVASAARRAASESRDVLSDLRRHTDLTRDPSPTIEDPPTPTPTRTPDTNHHLLAIVSEALENAYRHARATEVVVEARTLAGTLHLTVTDDGVGLPPGLTADGAARAGHFGLLGMRERAATIGARLSVGGSPTGGTSIRVTVPLPSPHPLREEETHA